MIICGTYVVLYDCTVRIYIHTYIHTDRQTGRDRDRDRDTHIYERVRGGDIERSGRERGTREI